MLSEGIGSEQHYCLAGIVVGVFGYCRIAGKSMTVLSESCFASAVVRFAGYSSDFGSFG